MQYLINRTWENAGGTWYEPAELLETYKPVVKTLYVDTTSSAGDWAGLAVMRKGKKYAVVPFYQANNYPSRGYSLTTDRIIAEYEKEPDIDYLYQVWELLNN